MAATKRKHRWYQFSLRTLLLFVLLVSICMSWLGTKMLQARRQREAVEALGKAGGWVIYDYEETVGTPFRRTAKPPAPDWQLKLFGVDFFADVDTVYGSAAFGDQGTIHLKGLSELSTLYLHDTWISDAGLEHVNDLTSLQCLILDGTNVTDAGLERLHGLNNLYRLSLENTQVTRKGVERFKKAMPNCDVFHD